MTSNKTIAALVGAMFGAVIATSAVAQVLADPSVDQLVHALQIVDAAGSTKAFRRTLPPNSNNLCPEGQESTPGNTRNIVVVPYHMQPSARVDLPMQFANDSDALDSSDRRTLNNLATAMNTPQLQSARFALAGHTSATGPADRNLELSCARSLMVRRYLVGRGVDAQRLTAYGFGFSKPLQGRSPEDALNRRVEINRE
jgi:outer membrane protein OmpA-like peptidoglycan-associated protein